MFAIFMESVLRPFTPGAHQFHWKVSPRSQKPGKQAMPAISAVAIRILGAISLVLLASFGAYAKDAARPTKAVGIENQYADIISQIGGKYVTVTAVLNSPSTDPHTFQANPKIAGAITSADLVVENGAGYDAWADKILSSVPNKNRIVINVQQLRGLPADTRNPHLWFDPETIQAVANAIAEQLSALQPAQAAYFQANLKTFSASIKTWTDALADFKADFPDLKVAVTEPVADEMLGKLGADIKTRPDLETAIMNGTDPSPQDVSAQISLLENHEVRVFIYNRQVTNSLTEAFLALAKEKAVPVVVFYETMPTPGFNFQSWMMAEVEALRKAASDKISTEVLRPAGP